MFNKKLVLGSLAGATLLAGAMIMMPATASAALMSGTCVNCHTMHDSVGGANQGGAGTYGNLLLFDGCVGCHANTDANDANGKGTNAPNAPQVNTLTNTAAGGYFVDGAAAPNPNGHDVSDMNYTMQVYSTANAPGANATPFVNAATAFECIDCHGEAQGGHHSYGASTAVRTGTTGDSYRMLNADTTNNGGASANYVVSNRTDGTYVPNADYDQPTMDQFCADCHGAFHGTAGQGTASPWIRHPTGVTAPNASTAAMPTGRVGTGTESLVMCLSCHAAHSTANLDMLRFNYALELARVRNLW